MSGIAAIYPAITATEKNKRVAVLQAFLVLANRNLKFTPPVFVHFLFLVGMFALLGQAGIIPPIFLHLKLFETAPLPILPFLLPMHRACAFEPP